MPHLVCVKEGAHAVANPTNKNLHFWLHVHSPLSHDHVTRESYLGGARNLWIRSGF